MTGKELRLVFEAEITKLPAEDRVLWMRFTSTESMRTWGDAVSWGWDNNNHYVAVGWQADSTTVYVTVPEPYRDSTLRGLSVREAAMRVMTYLRKHYTSVATA